MNKQELNDVICVLRDFITTIHELAMLPIPDEFMPEEQALLIWETITQKARIDFGNQLMMAKNTEEELVDLTERMSLVSEKLQEQTLETETTPCSTENLEVETTSQMK